MYKLIILIFLSFTTLFTVESTEIPITEQERLQLLAELFNDREAKSWPTLDWHEAPLIVTFENGHIFAFNLKSQDLAWEKKEIAGVSFLFATEDHWGLKELHMQPWFPIEEQKAFVYRMNGQGKAEEDVRVLVHERFHRHQKEHFQLKSHPGISRDHLNEENLAWIEIEDQLFRDFLAASDGQSEILLDLVAVIKLRREMIDEDTLAWENHQWKMEGLADYVGSSAFGRHQSLLDMHPAKPASEYSVDEAIKWRHYMAGATVGFALDYIQVKGWHEQVEGGAELTDLLLKNMPISKPVQEKRLKKLKKRFQFKKRRKKIAQNVSTYEAQLESLHQSYAEKPGVVLYMGRPGGGISGGGSNEKLYYLGDGSTVGVHDNSVSSTADGGWKLSTYNISHLYQHSNGLREVKLSPATKIQMDKVSWAMPEILSEPREFLFTSLVIEDNELAFASKNHVGVMVSDGECLVVKYVKVE